MRRLVPGLAIPILLGLPLSVEASWLVALPAMASATLCVVAVLRWSPPLATAGGAFGLISLALALRDAPSSAGMLAPFVFGLALLFLVDGVHLGKRLDGAAVARVLWHRRLAWWTARAAISLGVAIVIAVLAPAITILLPLPWGPFLAGIGVVVTLAAALTFAWTMKDE